MTTAHVVVIFCAIWPQCAMTNTLCMAQDAVIIPPGSDDQNSNKTIVTDFSFSPDGSRFAVSYGIFRGLLQSPDPGRIVVWSAASGHRQFSSDAFNDGVASVRFSGDGKYLIAASYDGTLTVRNSKSYEQVKAFSFPQSALTCLAVSPDGRYAVTGCLTGGDVHRVHIVSLAKMAIVGVLTGHTDDVLAVAVSPDSKSIASSGMDSRTIIWEMKTREPRQRITTPNRWSNAISYSPDGQYLALGGHEIAGRQVGFCEIYDIKRSTKIADVDGIVAEVTRISFSPDSANLAIASEDGHCTIWSMRDPGNPLRLPGEIHELVFGPGNDVVAVRTKASLRIDVLSNILRP